jgi:hypothetical protein
VVAGQLVFQTQTDQTLLGRDLESQKVHLVVGLEARDVQLERSVVGVGDGDLVEGKGKEEG